MTQSMRQFLSGVLVVLLVALPLPYLLRFDHQHIATAAVLAALLCALALRSRQTAVAVTLGVLAVLGEYRRYAGYLQGYPASDYLLLVAPIVAFFICCLGMVSRVRPAGSGALSVTVMLLAALMTAQIFNPAQGGLEVGLAGALFYLVPLLWFWIGRSVGNSSVVDLALRGVILPVGVTAAAFGLFQSLHGLLPFEAAWAESTSSSNYNALLVSRDVLRAFGLSSSGSEYTRFLLITTVVIVAHWLADRSRWIWATPLLVVALFLASSRGPMVFLVLTSVALWAVLARKRITWFPRFLVAAIAGFGVLAAALLALKSSHPSDDRIDVLVSHQVEGLLDPTNAEKSTAVGHLALSAQALLEGVTSPAGHGLGATTLAAIKYGSGAFSAEMDFANVFYSLGLIGGLLYLAIMGLALQRALATWDRSRSAAELSMVAILISTLTAWMIGGEYSIAAIVWFVIGAVDRSYCELQVARRRAHTNAYRISHA